ncbi:precorrin-3B C(17)-methyltransferase [Flexibacterium corallicola]|uniref:precorrin-3B C(17)-methyltransferase n=1 Tax=Flexibacterium corallicola TaxID=3037259 RepID=UPI00286EFC54|nr:precorrin-3B C(17)-methyltransferase [Pseudovibrio sp. M1P-2-3]
MVASPAILVVNPVALPVARRIQTNLAGSLVHGFTKDGGQPNVGYDQHFSSVSERVQELFEAGTPIIGVCAAGILIRAVSPVLDDKMREPPMLAVSENGASVVPLLGGHHGANDLARELANFLEGHAAITTAGDTAFGLALDEPPLGWSLGNPEDAKSFMASSLAGKAIKVSGDIPWVKESGLTLSEQGELEIIASEKAQNGSGSKLVYHPKTHVVGVGCARGCALQELEELVIGALENAGIALGSVAAITSIDLKADERAINQLAQKLSLPFRVFSASELEEQTPRLANPSDVVFAEVSCHGVSEGSALAAVGGSGTLVLAKQKTKNATVAIARAPLPLNAEEFGRARGRLHVIGIGPGKESWRAPEASRWISEADEVVGYGLYLDLVSHLIAGKERHAFPLGAEEDRVRFALEQAAKGRKVALVCSGDSGIYAMGALVYELLDRSEDNGGVSDGARRVEVASAPGISAMVALSNLIGAPLGHDFCAISLSDLLTPWETIQQRLKGAAEGDFVIGFYNPVSKRRRTQLAYARDLLLQHRPKDTPVVLGSNIGRETQSIRITTLSELKVDDVDMLTTVMVGCSQSRQGGDGVSSNFVYTPRGYAKRIDAPRGEKKGNW